MNFVTLGQKKNPAIVFLHGWGGSTDSWLGVAKRISGFGFFAVIVDFAGFGKTPEPVNPYGVENYAKDVATLITELDLCNVTIVGHSFGGRVAIYLAAAQIVNIGKVVLVDSAGVLPRRGIKYKLKTARYKSLKRQVLAGKKDESVLNKYGSEDYRILSRVMKQTFINVVNLDLLNHAKTINIKTLIVWGRYDKDTPLYMAKKLHRAIKNSRLIVYAAGHYSYIDRFADFVEELYLFLLS